MTKKGTQLTISAESLDFLISLISQLSFSVADEQSIAQAQLAKKTLDALKEANGV